jgi:hypothetical protein
MSRLRLFRDASDRLTLKLDRLMPTEMDVDAVSGALGACVPVTFEEARGDSLGDAVWRPFRALDQELELAWDGWLGWHITCLRPSAEDVLQMIAQRLDAEGSDR